MEKLKLASVPRIFIERAGNRVRVKIFTARPGIVIGKKGQEVENMKAQLAKLTGKEVLLDIQEVKKPEVEAQLVAENVALQLERRIAFVAPSRNPSRLPCRSASTALRSSARAALAAPISPAASGSARAVSRCTRCARISITGFAEAQTVWGKIGVKCWICKKDESN